MRRVGLLVVMLSLLGLPSAAAETWDGADREGDVTRIFYSPKPPPCGTSKSSRKPGNKKFDIVRLSVDHGLDLVVVEVAVRDLRRRQKFFVELNLRTSGRNYTVDVDRFEVDERVDVFLAREPKPIEPDECGFVAISSVAIYCAGAVGEADAALDVVRLTLPRTCVKNPDWVRAGAGMHGFRGAKVSFHDTWGRKKDQPKDNWLVNPLGPRVHVDAP